MRSWHNRASGTERLAFWRAGIFDQDTRILLVLAAATVVGIRLLTRERQPPPKAIEALTSDERIQVVKEPWLTFAPTQGTPEPGFIFCPGGRIGPQGYAHLKKAMAAEG